MTFPTIVSSASSANLSGASVGLSMPSGLVAGNALVLFTQYTGGSGYNVSGWDLVATAADSSAASALAIWRKLCTGSDTATLTTNDSLSHVGASICHQISGWSGTLADITGTAANPGTTASGTLDSPNHTAPFTRDNLWFTVGAGTGAPAMTEPTGYTGNASTALYGTNAATLAQAWRNSNAGSENPGAWTGNLTARIYATVVVPPAVSEPYVESRRRRRQLTMLVR